jgi:hypothetical protein
MPLTVVSQTPFQQKLALAAYDARMREKQVVADMLNRMILAAARGHYRAIGALHATLPITYRKLIGPAPRSRDEDR